MASKELGVRGGSPAQDQVRRSGPRVPVLVIATVIVIVHVVVIVRLRVRAMGQVNPSLVLRGTFIDVFAHRVHLEVDEAGTKAWRVTWARAVKAKARPFRAGRPFLFFLREVRSGLLLLMGRVSNPR